MILTIGLVLYDLFYLVQYVNRTNWEWCQSQHQLSLQVLFPPFCFCLAFALPLFFALCVPDVTATVPV